MSDSGETGATVSEPDDVLRTPSTPDPSSINGIAKSLRDMQFNDDFDTDMRRLKRKVPTYQHPAGSIDILTPTTPARPRFVAHLTKSAKMTMSRKITFLQRKSVLCSLYIEAQRAVISESERSKKKPTSLPDVEHFEKLLTCLVDVGPGGWNLDELLGRKVVGLRQRSEPEFRRTERWRTTLSMREKRRQQSVVDRGGLTLEGSFEIDCPSKSMHKSKLKVLMPASKIMRDRAREVALLKKLVLELDYVIKAFALPSAAAQPNVVAAPAHEHPPSATPEFLSPPPMGETNSKECIPADIPTTKKGKKKKRSAWANQNNPHHVNNCQCSVRHKLTGRSYDPRCGSE